MNKRKIYVIGDDKQYASWILPLGFEFSDKLEDSDLCLLSGGEDWSSEWYNCENPHPSLGCNMNRDKREMGFIKKAIKLQIPIVGICRGSQILPVLVDNKKGKIVQHQNNPSFFHPVKTYDDKTIECTSSHHNAAWPYDLKPSEYKLLAWSENLIKFRYLNNKEQNLDKPETEVVFYPTIKALGFQMHPEWQTDNIFSIDWYQKTLNKFLFNGKINGKEKACKEPRKMLV